ncbi:MAG: alanine--tRNA ligase [Chitinispirillaceae bacterium]|nr:alanine--tRNA ligase [Chitinispirillaceae bacterium]
MKSSREIRKEFIDYFSSHEHQFIPTAPVVPQDDPTLLFTNAGMNQFKSIFLGDNPRGLKRAANSQKCMRVSGKHNDLEEVGRDHYHHTFFEMLGNWSFGNYYKKEAIKWAWDLLTRVWNIPKDRLFATVHYSDEEAIEIWKTETDIPHNRIMKFGDKSNFWEMGETGPCGPCSEIHYDLGDAATREETYTDPVKGVNGENARYRELWNLVFIQYNREKDGSLKPLPRKHVDTGMGFERIVGVIQGVESNYDTDIFQAIIQTTASMSGKAYDPGVEGTPHRVIADHIRSLVFAITDGAFPSNEGRGYVLRRLLRRAYRFGRELGFKEPFLYKLVNVVIREMGDAFPEITQRQAFVEEVIHSEEQRFGATLEQGIEKFNLMVENCLKKKETTLNGQDVFTLYDTYGFPMDLTRLMAQEKNLAIDELEYRKLMDIQKDRAREARKTNDGLTPEGWTQLQTISGTEFLGYEQDYADVNVGRYKMVITDEGSAVYFCILDKTPFYAETGGQVGDIGTLICVDGTVINVEDTTKWNDLVIHRCTSAVPLTKELLSKPLTAQINITQRESIRRNHTATHLLQAALRSVLGDHVQQSGSKVEPSGLRFDFTHFKALSTEELVAVETLINKWILADFPVTTDIKDVATAKAEGATALFGEKYGDKVRVVSVGQISKELCGGTHVRRSGEIGLLHITVETSISAGVRRIEAVTGTNTLKLLLKKEAVTGQLCLMLKTSEDNLIERVGVLQDSVRQLELQIKELSAAKSAGLVNALFDDAARSGGKFQWVVRNLGTVDKDSFTSIANTISDEIKNRNLGTMVVFIGAIVEDKVLFAAGAGSNVIKADGVHCGELVKLAAQKTGGGGGGSPFRAQAGGKDSSKLEESLAAVKDLLSSKAG